MSARNATVAALIVLGVAAESATAQGTCRGGLELHGLSGPATDIAAMAAMADSTVPVAPFFRRASQRERVDLCGAPRWAADLLEAGDAPLVLGELELNAAPLSLTTVYNSAYPRDRYNGALWAGRGLSAVATAGVEARWRWLSAAVRPQLLYQQNADFRTVATREPGHSPLIYPWHAGIIDWPQRFGTDSFHGVDAGRSYLRVDLDAVAFGVSNENLWWGPSQRYPLILGNSAGGFPHLFVGTSEPPRLLGGEWRGEVLWGRLEESDYFDNDAANDLRLFSALALSYSPGYFPGLSVGAARTYSTAMQPERFSAFDLIGQPFRKIQENPQGDFGDDQLIAAYMRWHLPASGFQAWVEWGRGDHWAGTGDLLREPEHTQVYTIGLSKLLVLENGWLRVLAELTDLERGSAENSGRATPVLYANGSVRQGHTHRGQLLGSPIGPGSNAQILAVDWLTSWGLLGADVERVRYDASGYYPRWAHAFGFHGHDIELTTGVRVARIATTWDGVLKVAYSHRTNRNFATLEQILLAGFDQTFPVDRNWALNLELRWKPQIGQWLR